MYPTVTISAAELQQLPHIKTQLLNCLSQFGSCCFLDNQGYEADTASSGAEIIAGAGVVAAFELHTAAEAPLLGLFLQKHAGRYIFGHLAYDLKAALHGLPNTHPNPIGFVPLCFFVPQVVAVWRQHEGLTLTVYDTASLTPEKVWQAITLAPVTTPVQGPPVAPRPVTDRAAYLQTIEQLKKHIGRGDCYEINFCQAFQSMGTESHPVSLFKQLSGISPNPFSCFYRQQNSYLACASPERYLSRRGPRLISQPIKGTMARNLLQPAADAQARKDLYESRKDRSENVMVVDLVRNDLSRVCTRGSVRVDELFGIYTYPGVHQMISTISGMQQPGISFWEILQATFPMGSMTGAPKRRVMQLTEQYEPMRRGLFSGAVGYFDAAGNFDFNVVIRSILYEATTRHLMYFTGGGITWYSDAEKEYAEMLLKGEAIRKVLAG